MNILHPLRNKGIRNEIEHKRKKAEADKDAEKKKIFEMECRECLFFWDCPCGYSWNNAACITIKRPVPENDRT